MAGYSDQLLSINRQLSLLNDKVNAEADLSSVVNKTIKDLQSSVQSLIEKTSNDKEVIEVDAREKIMDQDYTE